MLLSQLVVLPLVPAPYTRASLNTSVTIDSDQQQTIALSWSVSEVGADAAPVVFKTKATLQAGVNRINSGSALVLTNPKLWWPNNFGAQPLYTMDVAVAGSSGGATLANISRSFGVRDLQHVRNEQPDSWTYIEEFACSSDVKNPVGGASNCTFPASLKSAGLSPAEIEENRNWTLQVNGRRVFAHGANWLPPDMRLGEVTAADYDYLVGTAADSSMNFLRVWGGGGIESDEFYDACDRHGVMVYQETVHSQSMPTRAINLANEKIETEQMINKLSSHPSIVRYGWGNEYYGVNHSSNAFERQYEDIARAEDPTRRATHGSPVTHVDRHGPYCAYLSTVGPGKASFPCWEQAIYQAFNQDRMHYDAHVMNQEGANNPMEWDEFGAAGASSEYTITQVIPKANLYPVVDAQADWVFHRATSAVGAGSDMWLSRMAYIPLFGEPPSLANEVRISQWTQMEGLRYANQAHVRAMPHRSMSAFWTLNEPWPNVAYGSVVDFFGEKKLAYYAATKKPYGKTDVALSYEALFIVAGAEPPPLIAWVTSEASVKGTLAVTVSSTDGKQLKTYSLPVAVTVGAAAMGSALKLGALSNFSAPASLAGQVLLVHLELTGTSGAHLATQLYTFGVLKTGSDVNANMTSVKPMQRLLSAPKALCKLSVSPCKGGTCTATVRNIGPVSTPPCLYVALSLRDADAAAPAAPQFHAASFSDNHFYVPAGGAVSVRVKRLPWRDGGGKLSVCAEGWNTARECAALE